MNGFGIGWNWSLDGWIVAAGVLCAVASALVGNFLVLRKLSMLGDAVSHAVLPGLAVAFFLSSSRSSLPMFLGAVVVGVLTALFTEWIRGFGKVDEGASMGVVFTSLFALGLVMIVQAADRVDLDAGCVLYGAIELTPLDTLAVGNWQIPRAVVVLAIVALINLLFVVVFFKELKLSAFDPALATTMGVSATWMHYMLMILVAVTAVASFESVGNILVVAMLIVPPATAYLLTDRLGIMIMLSVVIAALGAVLGHLGALMVPGWFGFRSTTTAGMMAVCVGLLFLLAVLFAPHQGVLIKWLRRRALSIQILSDDIVAYLFRREERGLQPQASRAELADQLLTGGFMYRFSLWRLRRRREIDSMDAGNSYRLTDDGRDRARRLVRSHRLWEQYLVSEVGMEADRIHDPAERLEHFTDRQLREELEQATEQPTRDPHGAIVPPEHDEQR
ncbi:MAG: metal ABC transporter permease [bacterium]|nr:metal ABC transporter permease [bacterium]